MAGIVELDDTAEIDPRAKPFVRRDLLDHAGAEAGIGHCKVVDRRADSDESQPVGTVGGAVDVVGISGKIVHQQFQRAGLLALDPISVDSTQPCAGPQHGAPIMRDANAIREREVRQNGLRPSRRGIVTDQPAVAPALETIERPIGKIVSRRSVAEIDLAVGRDVEIVGQPKPRVVL